MTLSLLNLPRPTTEKIALNGQVWSLSLYEEFLPFFKNEHGEFAAWFKQTLEQHTNLAPIANYRVQIHFKTVPFLVGFLFDQKEILLTSFRLNRELFLLQELERHKLEEILSDIKQKELGHLMNHVVKMNGINLQKAPSIIERATKQFNLPDFLNNKELHNICERSRSLENELLIQMEEYQPTLLERLSNFVLNLTTRYTLFRVHLLKFVALLPSIDHDKKGKEHKRIFLETLRRLLSDSHLAREKAKTGEMGPLPSFLAFALQAATAVGRCLPAKLLSAIIRWKVTLMAKRFLAGESIEQLSLSLQKFFASGRDVTLDPLGERVVSEKEADQYLAEVLKLIRGLSLHIRRGEKNGAEISKAHLSIKVSALTGDFNPRAPEATLERVAPRLRKILLEAKRENVFVCIDAEHYETRDLTFFIYRRVLLETKELKDFTGTGMVLQAYLRDAARHFEEILELTKKHRHRMPIRLVKGAYWDEETITAKAYAYDPPTFINKEETDIHFRQLIYKILEAGDSLQLCLGSHNLSDHCFAETLREEKFPNAPQIEHQCLHMTYESLSWGMAKKGWAVRNYVTVGSLLGGMAYLVRRILENSSQAGILAMTRSHEESAQTPHPHILHLQKKENGKLEREKSITALKPYFVNMIPVHLYLKEERECVLEAYTEFTRTKLGVDYSKDGYSGAPHRVFTPSDPEILVGQITMATKEDAERAIEAAYSAYLHGGWAKAHPIERVSLLLKAADQMLLKRLEFASLIVHEGGKTFVEAIADVNEAIDFLSFYAREEARLTYQNKNFVSRGVFAAISPWNFPLAIPTGMSIAALAAGNSVILKPSEFTPLVTQKLTDLLYEVGIPKDVFVHLPGPGSVVGKLLSEHKKIHGIVFTGSKSAGLSIAQNASTRINHNELFDYDTPTKVITEMGGKNAIIVTQNGELDEAISAILYSAFGNAGQKCSAASRILVDNQIKEKLKERLKEACKDIGVGSASDMSTIINPLIARRERDRLEKVVKEVAQEAYLYGGTILLDRSQENLPGHCMGPVLIELPALRALHSDSFAKKELFGPILHIIGYSNLKEAIQLFNATEYALTGAIFSQSQDTIDTFRQHLEAGNIYVNRHCTGARVAIEPFGGFKLSGTGPKAGSTSYLDAFHVDLKSVQAKDEKPVAIDREGINQFKTFIQQSLVHFVKHRYWNRKIPGQISFNDLTRIKETGIYIALEDQPHLKTFLYFLAALAVGSFVRILCFSEKANLAWSTILHYLEEAGFPREALKIIRSDKHVAKKIIQEEDPEFIIVEGDSKEVEGLLEAIQENSFGGQHMKTVLTKLDAPAIQDFERYLEQFVLVRSFAINTMRYGAPLELDL